MAPTLLILAAWFAFEVFGQDLLAGWLQPQIETLILSRGAWSGFGFLLGFVGFFFAAYSVFAWRYKIPQKTAMRSLIK